jgi:hypothetical protein
LQTVGTVQTYSGETLTGIEGSAYFPGFKNIFAFWTDPSDQLTRLAYVNVTNANAVFVGSDLGKGKVMGATGVAPPSASEQAVYVIQSTDPVSFTINNGTVTPNQSYAAGIELLGASITAGGAYDVPVTVKIRVNNAEVSPFGLFTLPVDANVNNNGNPRTYILPSEYAGGAGISVIARSWLKNSGADGTNNNDWYAYMTVDSGSNSPNVKVLRDGDSVPNIPGFMNQSSVEAYVNHYIDHQTNKMRLHDNEVIYLFELGTTDINSAAADFQDAVVVVRLAEDVVTLTNELIHLHGTIAGSIGINPNNTSNHEFTLVKADGQIISRDDLQQSSPVDNDGVFFSGDVLSIRVKPKGGGGQGQFMVNDEVFSFENNTAYQITADTTMAVTLRNDHVVNGTAMGQWYIDFTGSHTGDVTNGENTTKLIRVNHETGAATQLMALSRGYDSLESIDGQVFYATLGGEFYQIDLTNHTETLLGTLNNMDLWCSGMIGSTLMGFDVVGHQVVPINPGSGQPSGTAFGVGMDNLGTIVLTPSNQDPGAIRPGFD